MNVAGYIRVSSEEQTENYSIPEQQDIIESYCKVRSWNLIKCYIDGGFIPIYNRHKYAIFYKMASFEHTSLILAVLFLGRLSYRKRFFKQKEPRNIDAKFYAQYNIFRDI